VLGTVGGVGMQVDFAAELWEHEGDGAWFFVSVPVDLSDEVRDAEGGARRGFGSLRVAATVGGTTWTTSVFPSKSGSYVLPVKKAVRKAEGIEPGDVVEVSLDLLDL
jgi:hypothetical protein